jgi:hypothetical protein
MRQVDNGLREDEVQRLLTAVGLLRPLEQPAAAQDGEVQRTCHGGTSVNVTTSHY